MMEGSSTIQQTTPSRPLPFREDCWSEEATSTLVDVWGRRYMELNRGNLRQKDWQEVADAVNALHGHTKKTIRTDVQCKNRIDTLKKKYKTEKAKIVESNGTLTSSWPFYSRLDALVGPNYNKQQIQSSVKLTPLGLGSGSSHSLSPPSPSPFGLNSPPMALPLPYRKPLLLPPPPMATVHPQLVVLPQKRPSPALSPVMDDSYFRRNYSAVAAAAAAKQEEEEDDGEGSEDEMENEEVGSEDADEEVEGISSLAKAIERFGEIYERVEKMKQRQMVELEKQRMQFTQDLEIQRMQLFADTKIHLEKLKRAKRSGSDDLYS